MPKDIERSIVPMAPSILKAKPTDREFRIPFKIEGERSVWAADIEGARRIAERIQAEEYAHYGDLETYEPEPVQ